MAGGAPKGNRNATKGKPWERMLKSVLTRYADPEKQVRAGEALERIAERVIAGAIEGDLNCIQEIGNRLDGKPAQSIDVTGEIKHVRELSDAELIERLERARSAGGALEETARETDAAGVH